MKFLADLKCDNPSPLIADVLDGTRQLTGDSIYIPGERSVRIGPGVFVLVYGKDLDLPPFVADLAKHIVNPKSRSAITGIIAGGFINATTWWTPSSAAPEPDHIVPRYTDEYVAYAESAHRFGTPVVVGQFLENAHNSGCPAIALAMFGKFAYGADSLRGEARRLTSETTRSQIGMMLGAAFRDVYENDLITH